MKFLSDEWIGAMDRAARSNDTLAAQGAVGPLTIQQTVTGGPDGPVTYRIDLSANGAVVAEGPADEPTVALNAAYDTATAIARGERSAQAAFMTGELKIEGDVSALLARHESFAALEDVFETVRAQTEY